MRLAPPVLLAALLAGCGPTRPLEPTAADVTEVQRAGASSALELLRGRYPSLEVEEGQAGVALRVRRTGARPVVVVDGVRSIISAEGATGLLPEDVVRIEVLTSMADTMIYGDDAALGGVVLITTRLGARR